MLELLNDFIKKIDRPKAVIEEVKPISTEEANAIDEKLLAIILKLESGRKLYKPVKFMTPRQLKQLGETMFLVNTEAEAQHIINTKRLFACTYPELKELSLYAKTNNSAGVKALMLRKIFRGKEIKEARNQ